MRLSLQGLCSFGRLKGALAMPWALIQSRLLAFQRCLLSRAD
jgi:hypothetical protein